MVEGEEGIVCKFAYAATWTQLLRRIATRRQRSTIYLRESLKVLYSFVQMGFGKKEVEMEFYQAVRGEHVLLKVSNGWVSRDDAEAAWPFVTLPPAQPAANGTTSKTPNRLGRAVLFGGINNAERQEQCNYLVH